MKEINIYIYFFFSPCGHVILFHFWQTIIIFFHNNFLPWTRPRGQFWTVVLARQYYEKFGDVYKWSKMRYQNNVRKKKKNEKRQIHVALLTFS